MKRYYQAVVEFMAPVFNSITYTIITCATSMIAGACFADGEYWLGAINTVCAVYWMLRALDARKEELFRAAQMGAEEAERHISELIDEEFADTVILRGVPPEVKEILESGQAGSLRFTARATPEITQN